MYELVELVSKKAGISEATAKKAMAVVVGYLNDNVKGHRH